MQSNPLTTTFTTLPIIGQEALTAYGLGRVVSYSADFPHWFIEVQPYHIPDPKTGCSLSFPMKFAPSNVTLIMPGTGQKVKVCDPESGPEQRTVPADSWNRLQRERAALCNLQSSVAHHLRALQDVVDVLESGRVHQAGSMLASAAATLQIVSELARK